MPIRLLIALLGAAFTCAACAIRPVPENFTGVKTAPIVHRIRCEMSEAVVEHVMYFNNNNKRPHKKITEDDVRRMTPLEARKIVGRFADLGVVYAFALDMTETNTAAIGADIVKPLGTIQTALFTISPSFSNTLQRQNLRAFTIVDDFETLRTLDSPLKDPKKRCLPDTGPNYEFPITGSIGLAEELRTFISLTFRENLSKREEDEKGFSYLGDVTSPAMADTITFTTTIAGGAPPKITLNQVGNNFQFTNAQASGLSASRIDKHQVIIGLGIPDPPPVEKHAGKKAAGGTAAAGLSGSPFLTASTRLRGGGVANALSAVNQQIWRFEIPRRSF